jgi:hypothetical protein
VVSIKSSVLRRVLATIIHSGNALSAVPRRLRCVLSLASVVLDEPVSYLSTRGNGQDTVFYTMLAVQRNWVVAARTSRQSCSRKHSNGAEVFGVAACKTEAHGSTVREAERESQLLIDAKIVFNGLADRVEEGDVFTTCIAPAFVQTVWRDKDGALLGEGLETIVWRASAVDRVHVTAQPVQTEDEFVGLSVVVVVWDTDDLQK